MKGLRSGFGLAGVAVLIVVTMFVVIPAFASTAGHAVPPASSPGGITPVDYQNGGQNNDCLAFYPAGTPLRSYSIDNPKDKTTYTDPSTGATFRITLDPLKTGYLTPTGIWPAYGHDKYFGFASTGAAVVDVGVKGGTDTTRYNYSGNSGIANPNPGFVQADNYLHAPAQAVDVHNIPTQLYGISHLTFCYGAFATISGTAFNDANGNGAKDSGEAGLSPVTVTLTDSTTHASTTQTTAGDGSYSFSAGVVGDGYTICIASPGTNYVQTLPGAAGLNCTTAGTKGYSGMLGSSGVSNQDFGFEPFGSISGKVYNDLNQNGQNDDGAPQQWTVKLYSNSSFVTPLRTTTSVQDGSYTFALALTPGTQYTVCELPPSGTWAQTVPAPNTPNVCTGSGGLPKGYRFTANTAGDVVTGDDFGNVAAEPCPSLDAVSSPAGVHYRVELADCKPGETYVIRAGFLAPPTANPYVSLWASDQTPPQEQQQVPMVEEITFPYPVGAGQNKLNLTYTDTYPFATSSLPDMPYCLKDPRLGGTDPLALPPWQINDPLPSGVLPNGATSCLIATTEKVDASGNGVYVAYVYSDIDGLRTSG